MLITAQLAMLNLEGLAEYATLLQVGGERCTRAPIFSARFAVAINSM
jgi:hypothetical protein